MNLHWPKEVEDFELFLKNAGLHYMGYQQSESFGDKLVQYANDVIWVQVVSDRLILSVDIADRTGWPVDWYDIGIIRELLGGTIVDGVFPLSEQIVFVQIHWQEILHCFNPSQREQTHKRLNLLRETRAKRMFPNLDERRDLGSTNWAEKKGNDENKL